MAKLMRAKDKIGVVADQRGSPTYAADLAAAIVTILRAPRPPRHFHFANIGETSWYEFAVADSKARAREGYFERDCAVEALTTAQYPTKAPAAGLLGVVQG